MSAFGKKKRETERYVNPSYLPQTPNIVKLEVYGQKTQTQQQSNFQPQASYATPPQYYPQHPVGSPEQPQQQQPQVTVRQAETHVTKTVNAEATVLQHNYGPLLRLCLIPVFVVMICGLVIAIFWNIQHNSPTPPVHSSKQLAVSATTLWSNNTNDAVKAGRVYSIFYPYTIGSFNDWEQIPQSSQGGIPGLDAGDFAKLVSIHSCCRTKKHIFICANTNRIDGAAFDIRLILENEQIYLQVFPVTKLLVGAECKLELELVDEN